jgi:UDP-glucuronate 4-epimerase
MLEGRPVPMFGDGTTRRDYTFIDDIVAGIRSAITYHRSLYEVINLGNNETLSLADMIRGLETALDVAATVQRLPEQPGDVPQTWARIDKARTLLEYNPRTSYDAGLQRFAEWLSVERS